MSIPRPSHESYCEMYEVVRNLLNKIQPGNRIKHVIPVEFIYEGDEDFNWDIIEEIQMMVRGEDVPSDVFVTLRFSDLDQPFVVDVYRLP